MRRLGAKRRWCGALCAAAMVLGGVGAGPAQGAAGDPLFVFFAKENLQPGGEFEGPCGLAVDSVGNFYVSDYYHHAVDVFSPSHAYKAQLSGEDPLDGPCALAISAAGGLYVNNFDRNVAKFTISPFPSLTPATSFSPGPIFDSAHPTGIAVDPTTGAIYVDDRTYIAVYEASGAPVEVGGVPLRIGLGSLEAGYGLAVSAFPATAGRLYVPDAATDTVKIYSPAIDPVNPVAVIDGHGIPRGGFVSLHDSAVAIDRATGEIYVTDNLQPEFYEHPEAAVYVFDSSGAYKGRLKYNIVDAGPPGLAVDNSASATQGRVYVTSGNSERAGVYAYPPGAAIIGAGVCAVGGACPTAAPTAPSFAAPSSAGSAPAAIVPEAATGVAVVEPSSVMRVRHRHRAKRRHGYHRPHGGAR